MCTSTDLETGASAQDASDGTENTLSLTHTMPTVLLAEAQEWISLVVEPSQQDPSDDHIRAVR